MSEVARNDARKMADRENQNCAQIFLFYVDSRPCYTTLTGGKLRAKGTNDTDADDKSFRYKGNQR